MLFMDRNTLFTDRIPPLSIRSIRTDRQTVYDHSCHENILSPTNEMRFTDSKTHFTERIPLLSIRSIRTDRHMAYTDRYGAGVLDNPLIRTRIPPLLYRASTSFNNNHVTQHIFYLQDIRRILDDLHLQKYQVNMAVNCSYQELHSQNQLA